jgi:hypothetical protein
VGSGESSQRLGGVGDAVIARRGYTGQGCEQFGKRGSVKTLGNLGTTTS